MKVWLLEFTVPYEGTTLLGIYSTEELALKAREEEDAHSYCAPLEVTSWEVDS